MPAMSTDLRQGFRLGPWKVEPLIGAISGPGGDSQHLEPKVMDVFVCLAEHANELVTRDELLHAVWNGQTNADELLTGAVSDLRRALQDGQDESTYIETVPKRGYRLIGQIQALAGAGLESHSLRRRTFWAAGGALIAALAVPVIFNVGGLRDRLSGGSTAEPVPSIAVLPFVNFSSDPELEWLADGLTEAILNALARNADLLVASRTSSFAFKGTNEDARSIAEKLDVDYVLEGSVRRDNESLSVTAQLIRGSDGFHQWSDTYVGAIDDVIAIQEDIAIEIFNALETALDADSLARMVSAGTTSVAAYQAYLEGLAYMSRMAATGDRSLVLKRKEAMERAVELDPEFAQAHLSLAGFWYTQLKANHMQSGFSELAPVEILARYDDAIDKAIKYANDPDMQVNWRRSKAEVNLRYKDALELSSEYLRRRPNSAHAQTKHMYVLALLDMSDELTDLIAQNYTHHASDEDWMDWMDWALQLMPGRVNHELIRTNANNAIERFGDEPSMLYRAHRALLWVGDTSTAGKILPMIRVSLQVSDRAKYYAALSQACAENRIADATRLHVEEGAKHADRIIAVWLGHKIMGNEERAIETLMELDDWPTLHRLAGFLPYSFFDPSPYPNLVALLQGQGIPPREVAEIPFRCNSTSKGGH